MEKYQARFFPGRPDFAPNMPGVDINRLQTYQLEVRFADITDNGMYRCVIEVSKSLHYISYLLIVECLSMLLHFLTYAHCFVIMG